MHSLIVHYTVTASRQLQSGVVLIAKCGGISFITAYRWWSRLYYYRRYGGLSLHTWMRVSQGLDSCSDRNNLSAELT
jgi:hypothetical protein